MSLLFSSEKTSLRSVNSYLLPVVESLWVVRVVLRIIFHCHCSVALREVQVGVDTVDLQKQLTGVYTMQNNIKHD